MHIIETAREDKDKFSEWADIMETHRKQALEFVKELAALARHDPDDQQATPAADSGDGDQEIVR